MRIGKRAFILLLAAVILPVCHDASAAAEAFALKRVGNLISFADNAFSISAPEAGEVEITIHDDISVYRVLQFSVPAGESTWSWDGCGYNRERLSPKSYVITGRYTGQSGREETVSFNTPVEYSGQDLQYALPSGPLVSLQAPDDWFLEMKTIQKGTVLVEFRNEGVDAVLHTGKIPVEGGKLNRIPFSRLLGRRMPDAGNYLVRVYEATLPDHAYTFALTVQEEAVPEEAPFVTGDILPEEDWPDAEIWALMMQPSVVVDIDFFKHQKVYAEKDPDAEVLGTLHGQTQGLKVISLEEDWARVGAWNHEEAAYVEGWVPRKVLKVVYPGTDYGLLIDKKTQTMKVYYQGRLLDTLRVSTGLAEKKHFEQETAAGAFLTGYHRVDFSTNGKKFDYVIQYDGGNMMHQIPYLWGAGKKDFSVGRDVLGQKASHACIRVQAEPGEGGLNAYWLWTHLPYHTRILILDDPEQREAEFAALRSGD